MMRPPDMVFLARNAARADVGRQQPPALGKIACLLALLSGILNQGPKKLALRSVWGLAQCTAPQKNRSRGCRAQNSPFWPLQWQHLCPPAPSQHQKKLSMSMSQPLRLSLPTPASTSKFLGRVLRAFVPTPALFLCCTRHFQKEGATC